MCRWGSRSKAAQCRGAWLLGNSESLAATKQQDKEQMHVSGKHIVNMYVCLYTATNPSAYLEPRRLPHGVCMCVSARVTPLTLHWVTLPHTPWGQNRPLHPPVTPFTLAGVQVEQCSHLL